MHPDSHLSSLFDVSTYLDKRKNVGCVMVS